MDRKPRLLIVEDETAIRSGLVDVFLYHGFQVDAVAEGQQGLHKATSGSYDMILLDVMLPGMDGYEICERLRERDRDQPIIMLTARSSDEDVIRGLALGADDYVAKPFSVAQLVLRVQAVLRRAFSGTESVQELRFGEDSRVDLLNLSGSLGAESVAYTRREIELIGYLAACPGRPVSRQELLAKVWGYGQELGIETRTVDIHIAKIRRKLEPDPSQPRYLITVRGAGYRLDLE